MKNKSRKEDRHKGEKPVTIWFKIEVLAALKIICIKEGRTRPTIIKRALALYAKSKKHEYPENAADDFED